MGNRGYFEFFKDHSAYKESTKRWYVRLLEADMLWYDLVVNGHQDFDTRRHMIDFLKLKKKTVEEDLERRFIYFIVSRERLRFAKRQPSYSLVGRKLQLWVEQGSERRLRKVTIRLSDPETGKPVCPQFVTDERFIYWQSGGKKVGMPIHDFLRDCNVNLTGGTQVHYVGRTSEPERRPMTKGHLGFQELLYRLADAGRDVFVVYNLFRVDTMAVNDRYGVHHLLPNSMSNEIDVDTEGRILENCLIRYFQSSDQLRNRSSEYGELQNSLLQLAQENRIESITMHYEMEEPSDYFRFYSSEVSVRDKHLFNYTIEGGELKLSEGSAWGGDLPLFTSW